MAKQDRAEAYADDYKPNWIGGLVMSLIIVATAGAAFAAYWTMTDRPVPPQLSGSPASPETIGAYGVIALILLGALAFVFLLGRALRRAFSPDYSGPYRVYILFTLVAAMISGYTTTYGVVIEFLDPAQGFVRYRLFPVVVFLYAFLFVFLTWSWTFDLVIRHDHHPGEEETASASRRARNRVLAAFAIPLIAAVPIFAVSTTTSALGLAGPRILERAVLGWMDDYSQSLRSLESYINEADSVALSLESLSTRMDTLAAQEAATGAITGYAGRGAVVNQLDNAADDLAQTADIVMREQAERLASVDEIGLRLEGARATVLDGSFFQTAAGDPLPVRDWQDRVRGLERQLGGQWETAASRSHVRAASGQLELMDRLIFGGAMSSSAAIATAQRDARGQISTYLAEARGVVQEEMSAAVAAETPEPPLFTYQSPLLVLFNSWEQAILPWVIAIAVDFGPWVWILLALIAGFDERARSRARYAYKPGAPGPQGHPGAAPQRSAEQPDAPIIAPGQRRPTNGAGATRH